MTKDKPPIQVFNSFCTSESAGQQTRFVELGKGNINETWIVSCTGMQTPSKALNYAPGYVLQCISAVAFSRPKKVAEQIGQVSQIIQKQQPGFVPEIFLNEEGLPWVEGVDGGIWKMSRYVHSTRSIDKIENEEQAYAVAAAFGTFQRLLDKVVLLNDAPPIRNFHRLAPQLASLESLLQNSDRVASAQDLINKILRAQGFWQQQPNFMNGKQACKTVIHGDCKVSNVLLTQSGKDVCAIVDLDTVMYGDRAWDFGDLVRSGANTSQEDAASANFSMPCFAALASGFIQALDGMMEHEEKQQLVLGAQYMTFMLAVRFLNDYLGGDIYFRVADAEQNLRRARLQMQLYSQMQKNEAAMMRCVRKL